MIADFIAPSDPRWRALVARVPHDFYHLPEYTVIAGRVEFGSPTAFYAELDGAACLIPLLIRNLPEGLGAPPDWRDATSPYGYPCPLTTDPDDAVTLARFLEVFRELGAARNLVSAFIRLHPLLTLPEVALRKSGSLEPQGRVVAIDLRLSPEELWAQTRRSHRYDIRKLERAGFVAAIDQWELYPEFILCYEETMRRVSASSFYFFPREYYDDLRAELGESVHLVTVKAPDGRLASGGVLFEEAGIVQYHLGATANALLRLAPAKLMFDFIRRWSRERANRVLHLGGGVGGREDSLFYFKAGFSNLQPEFQTLRVVFDDDRYQALAGGLDLEPPDQPGFFPLYRSPRHRALP